MLSFLKKHEPPEMAYLGYQKHSPRRLKSGWTVFFLVNSVVVLRHDSGKELNFGMVKKLIETNDGKFMIMKKDHTQAIFDPTGEILADFAPQAYLFNNGWFTCVDGDNVSLFDEKNNLICSKVTKALVFDDGKYFISVTADGDAENVGFFNADGSRIIFSNDRSFKCLNPYFFIADGSLYSMDGECLIEANQGSNFNRRLVKCIGALPFWKH